MELEFTEKMDSIFDITIHPHHVDLYCYRVYYHPINFLYYTPSWTFMETKRITLCGYFLPLSKC